MPPSVTGMVLTLNGQEHLEKTLRSLSFCSRILVVDSGSTDQTPAIAEQNNAEVVFHEWPGFIEQHRFALSLIDTEWVVTLDQDEHLSDELKTGIREALRNPGDIQGFFCSRRSFYFDRFIRHSGWYPDFLLRVFRKETVILGGNPPHEEYTSPGPTARLTGDIIHYPYRNLAEHLAKLNLYTQNAAEDMHSRGRHTSLAGALGHALSKFMKQYFIRQGFLDGRAGFLLAVHGFFYSLHKYVRLMELETRERNHGHKQAPHH